MGRVQKMLSWQDFIRCLPAFFSTRGSILFRMSIRLPGSRHVITLREIYFYGRSEASGSLDDNNLTSTQTFATMHQLGENGQEVLSDMGKISLDEMDVQHLNNVYRQYANALNVSVTHNTLHPLVEHWMNSVMAHIEQLRRSRKTDPFQMQRFCAGCGGVIIN